MKAMRRRSEGTVETGCGRRRGLDLRQAMRRRSDEGSGTAIGVAIIFPALMLLIVLLSALTDSVRIEQALQAAANRAARTASLCCQNIDGPQGALAVVESSLESAEEANAFNRIFCNNDLAGDANIVFTDVDDTEVAAGENNPVPPAGTVYVFLRCRIPPKILGGFGIPYFNAERLLVGVATLDPYRSRS